MAAQGKAKRAAKTGTTSRAKRSAKGAAGGKTKRSAAGKTRTAAPTRSKGAARATAERGASAKAGSRAAGKRAAPKQAAAKRPAAERAATRTRRDAQAEPRRAAAAKTTAKRTNRSRATATRKTKGGTRLPAGYRPSEDEEFMSARQREYFRRRLIAWRDEILAESRETIEHLREQNSQEPDLADRATIETERLIELRTRDRERKLLSKIDDALTRIEDGSYGYCLETGDAISLRRLEARPIATLSIDAQERHERLEKTYRDE